MLYIQCRRCRRWREHGDCVVDKERFYDGLKRIGATWNGDIPAIKRLVDDTREVRIGDCYVLRQGAQPLSRSQAEAFLHQAEEFGAVAVIIDPEFKEINVSCKKIVIPSPHLHLGELAEAFYGNPSMKMKMVAVTGTNGKTTTTYLIESLAKSMGLRVGVLGTISYRYPGYEEVSGNTTPGTLMLFRLLSEMVDAGCELVAMEVSSHGIVQGRIDGVYFDVAIWNNLGTDHLDFHVTREAYALAKQRLFDHYLVESFRHGKRPAAIGNANDDEVMSHLKAAKPDCWGGRVFTYSVGEKEPECFATSDITGILIKNATWQNGMYAFDIVDKKSNICIRSGLPLIGDYNLSNAAAAVMALLSLGYDVHAIGNSLYRIEQIPGRMEIVYPNGPVVIVDFAHTPEALENALDAARACVPEGGNLRVVFGAGGDRDPGKRPMMGAAASEKADKIYVTSDNPRTEDPLVIVKQIVEGIDHQDKAVSIVDRKVAIEQALRDAGKKDLVLIVGKGHEDYQIIGVTKIHFDDREIIRDYYHISHHSMI